MRRLSCVAPVARRSGRCPVWAPTVAVGLAGRLRCDARIMRAAAVPLVASLNAPRPHGSSPVRPFRAGLPLTLLRFSPPHKSPTPGTAHRAAPLVVFVNAGRQRVGKAVGGCASAATSAAPSSAERMAARAQRALQHLTRRDCSSVASFSAGHEIEQRREPLAQRGAAAAERRRIPARGFACADRAK